MKKIIALALAAVMMFSMTALFVSAADLTPSKQSDKITISYTADDEYYEVMIPADVTLGELNAYVVTTGVKLDNVSLTPGSKLKVTAASANNFAVTMQGTNHKVSYTMKYGAENTEVSNAVGAVTLIDIEAGTLSADCPIAFKRTGNAAVSGTYTDTMTFAVEVYS